MNAEIKQYNENQLPSDREICNLLSSVICNELIESENKMWHAHPVWFINGNPIVGYSKQKSGIRLMFWSGADFGEIALTVKGAKFKDASIFYANFTEIVIEDLIRWLKKSREIQWDYKNLIKKKGILERMK